MTVQLRVENLTVSYPLADAPAIRAIGFALAEGESLCVVGESGSGKSTLALAIAGLLPPGTRSTGAIDWQGRGNRPRAGKDVGMIFQDAVGSLDPVMAVGRQVAEVAATTQDLSSHDADHAARLLLADMGFTDVGSVFSAYPHQLSGGQAQRVAIACALAGQPSLLIADEATSALDTIVQAQIAALLRKQVASNALSLMFITHDLALARSMSASILILRNGKAVRAGSFSDVMHDPEDAYVSRLIDSHIALPTVAGAQQS